ncbi:GlsB/YeaQ/YmgE family stress response membrane protein, partial [Odoribacter splanchnicus]
DQPLGLLGTPGIGFAALILIGGMAGWIAGMITGSRHWLFTNILIGICGSWIGSKLADVTGVAVEGHLDHFVAALVGSVIILLIW